MAVQIIQDLCRRCGKCESKCPNNAIKITAKPPVDPEKCIECEECVFACINGAIVG